MHEHAPEGAARPNLLKRFKTRVSASFGYCSLSIGVNCVSFVKRVCGVLDACDRTSSMPKSMSGHSLGAASVHEAIYSLLMMAHSFTAASANIDDLDPGAAGLPIMRQRLDHVQVNTSLSNNFGFGGANACLVFRKYQDEPHPPG